MGFEWMDEWGDEKVNVWIWLTWKELLLQCAAVVGDGDDDDDGEKAVGL